MAAGKFAFLVHPTDIKYMHRKFPFTRHLPERVIEAAFKPVKPWLLSQTSGIASAHNTADGHFVAVPLTARQFSRLPEPFLVKRVLQAVAKAKAAGARIVGLGAHTAVIGDAGVEIARQAGVAITTGNSYTVAAALEGLKEGARRMGHDLSRATLAVVGATGSIGSACVRIMARECRDIKLIGRSVDKLEALARRVQTESGVLPDVSTEISRVLPKADLVVAVSSSAEAIIQPADLKPGAVVLDAAMPRDVDERVARERDDVLVLDGGIIEIPGDVNLNHNFGFPSPNMGWACLSETILLALEERYENFTLGRDLTVEQIDEITRLARKHGFRLAGMRSFHRWLDDTTLERIKRNAARRLQAQTVPAHATGAD